MATGQRSNSILVPQARAAMDKFKWETAQQVGLNLQPGDYGGDIPSRMWGAVGGHMVRQMIQSYQQGLAGQGQVQATTTPQPSQFQGQK
ncbi:MAG TPA: alpha/beta-type small acid-soluble spore protein [Clostridia bacterium]|nr:alpha/beta-type small acid-soluble spore protein [Clostridia bacterium]